MDWNDADCISYSSWYRILVFVDEGWEMEFQSPPLCRLLVQESVQNGAELLWSSWSGMCFTDPAHFDTTDRVILSTLLYVAPHQHRVRRRELFALFTTPVLDVHVVGFVLLASYALFDRSTTCRSGNLLRKSPGVLAYGIVLGPEAFL